MRMRTQSRGETSVTRHLALLLLLLGLALTPGCGGEPDPGAFETPEAAADALLGALGRDDAEGIVAILGPEYRDQLITSDWQAQAEARQELVQAWNEQYALRELPRGERELILGAEEWPMPILLVQDAEGAWRFDTAEGIEEILDRRIGRHELTAIEIARLYVDAQIAYAREDRDGDQVLEYAQRLASTPGQHDGLYWTAGPDEPESPFGPLISGAESYFDHKQPGDPIQGYFFKILTRQGESPPGGAYDYVINGHMIAGFALVAWPETYGESGVMTFVVSHHGKVWQKDLGPFRGMEAYDPDESWSQVED